MLLGSCETDLGECDDDDARRREHDRTGKPNTGQVVIEKTCAGGRCHCVDREGQARVGVPAGLNFDVLPSDTSMPRAVERITKSAKVVKDHADEMWGEIEDGEMPPKNQGRDAELATTRRPCATGWPAARR